LDRVGRAAGADPGLAAAADSRLVARVGFPAGPGVRPGSDSNVDPTAGIGVPAVVGVSLSTPSGSRLDARIAAAVGLSRGIGIGSTTDTGIVAGGGIPASADASAVSGSAFVAVGTGMGIVFDLP
jgi:hypothetical protein